MREQHVFDRRYEPFECVHREDPGSGSQPSRLWSATTTAGAAVLRAPECVLKWLRQIRPPDSGVDTVAGAGREHPDWDDAPPPVFSGTHLPDQACADYQSLDEQTYPARRL